jgi:hypothetical protein
VHCVLSYILLTFYGYISIVACISYTLATTKPITIVNCIHVCNIADSDLHLELNYTVLTLSPEIFCTCLNPCIDSVLELLMYM